MDQASRWAEPEVKTLYKCSIHETSGLTMKVSTSSVITGSSLHFNMHFQMCFEVQHAVDFAGYVHINSWCMLACSAVGMYLGHLQTLVEPVAKHLPVPVESLCCICCSICVVISQLSLCIAQYFAKYSDSKFSCCNYCVHAVFDLCKVCKFEKLWTTNKDILECSIAKVHINNRLHVQIEWLLKHLHRCYSICYTTAFLSGI